MSPTNDPLLQPFKLKNLVLKNRILSTAHAPSYVEDGKPKERYRLYHEEKAKGGLALTMFGGSTNISPDSPSVFGQIYAGDDTIIPWFEKLAEGVQAAGAAVMCQLTHMGRRTVSHGADWLPIVGPSVNRERAHRGFPKEMETHDIRRIINDFAEAARRCKQAGLDGIELLAHGHLLGQFMTPTINQRTDGYGGTLANRMRLTVEVLEAVRSVVGSDFIVGIRLTGDELSADGLSAEECVEIAGGLEQSGMVDFLNVMAGQPYTDLGLASWVPPMGLPSAAHLNVAGHIKQAVTLPVFHAGGIADLATARHALQEGLVDMVGMTRAHMADPYLVAKLQRGEEGRIRPCVGLGFCVDRVNQGMDALCAHNGATGREGQMPHVIAKSLEPGRRVVIVGGGPAGLEAARVCAERGHAVTLFEATDRLGGQLVMAAKPTSRQQIWGVADWLIKEVEQLGVDIRLNHLAEIETVQAENPDIVIIATGGWPNTDIVEGAQWVSSVSDILSGFARPRGTALVYDDHGANQALSAALYLTEKGVDVHFVTPDRAPAQELGPTTYSVILRDLYAAGVRFSCDQEMRLVAKTDGRLIVTLANTLTGFERQVEADHVIVEHATLPIDVLYMELKPYASNGGEIDYEALLTNSPQCLNRNPDGLYQLFRIGDAVSSRGLHAAIYDALRLCISL